MELKTRIMNEISKIFMNELDFRTYLEDISNFKNQKYYNLIAIRCTAPAATHVRTERLWLRDGIQIRYPYKRIPVFVGDAAERFFDPLSRGITVDSEDFLTTDLYDISATDAADLDWKTKSNKIKDKEGFYAQLCWFFHQDPDPSDQLIDEKIGSILNDQLAKKIQKKSLNDLEAEMILKGCLYTLSYHYGLDLELDFSAFHLVSSPTITFYRSRYYASLLCKTSRSFIQLITACQKEYKQKEEIEQIKEEVKKSVEEKMASQTFSEKIRNFFSSPKSNCVKN